MGISKKAHVQRKSRHAEYEQTVGKAYRALKRSYSEIRDSYSEMIFRFALAAEYRDESTGTHLVKVADYCTEIGKEMKLSAQDIEILRYASPMHDIGKLAIPDVILKKNSGLTPEEREVMKKHPAIGAQIFQGSRTPLLTAVKVISLTHHERFDGTGYPQGLQGKDIPLFGRIVALADVFDALTSRRPYKDPYEFEEAATIIEKSAGTHFDPEVVKAFLKRKAVIKKIWEATRDIENFLTEHSRVVFTDQHPAGLSP